MTNTKMQLTQCQNFTPLRKPKLTPMNHVTNLCCSHILTYHISNNFYHCSIPAIPLHIETASSAYFSHSSVAWSISNMQEVKSCACPTIEARRRTEPLVTTVSIVQCWIMSVCAGVQSIQHMIIIVTTARDPSSHLLNRSQLFNR